MKKCILLAVLAAIVTGCGSDEPQRVDRRAGYRPEKAPPSVSSQKAEDFRAVEKPSSYSE